MKKVKKYRLKNNVIVSINFILLFISFYVDKMKIENFQRSLIISILFIIILYNCNILNNRITKENK